jgi:catechol 2,3-dioxygenase
MTTNEQKAMEIRIDPQTEPGFVSLTVADLKRSLEFYTEALGFAILQQDGKVAILGTGNTPLLVLTELTGATPWPHDQYGYTGLYHIAIRVPTRADLGRWLRNWFQRGLPMPGQGDHIVSEAIYLSDPDGNGVEVYCDRPRDTWTWVDGKVQMGTGPVDIRGLLDEAERAGEPWTGFAAGTVLGHMHLQVGNIPQAVAFYHNILGFDIVAQMPSALFVSAGGYHHHIGMNIWHSRNAEPAPKDMAGLSFFTLNFANEEAQQAVIARITAAGLTTTQNNNIVTIQDPWQNTILLQIGTTTTAQVAELLA